MHAAGRKSSAIPTKLHAEIAWATKWSVHSHVLTSHVRRLEGGMLLTVTGLEPSTSVALSTVCLHSEMLEFAACIHNNRTV